MTMWRIPPVESDMIEFVPRLGNFGKQDVTANKKLARLSVARSGGCCLVLDLAQRNRADDGFFPTL